MKNVLTIITVCISGIALVITLSGLLTTNAKADTKFRIVSMKNDSLHDEAIIQVKSANEAVNKRVDKVVDEQNTVNKEILTTLKTIQSSQDIHTKVLKEVCKEVKSLNNMQPFLETTQKTK